MKHINKILFILLLNFSLFTYSQVNVTISNVQLDGQSYSNNQTVQLGSKTSARLSFRVDVNKPNELKVGSVRYSIGTYNASGNFTLQLTQETLWLGIGNTGSISQTV